MIYTAYILEKIASGECPSADLSKEQAAAEIKRRADAQDAEIKAAEKQAAAREEQLRPLMDRIRSPFAKNTQ